MRIIYKPVVQLVKEAIKKAKNLDMMIDRIEMHQFEHSVFINEISDIIDSEGFRHAGIMSTLDGFDYFMGVKIVRVR